MKLKIGDKINIASGWSSDGQMYSEYEFLGKLQVKSKSLFSGGGEYWWVFKCTDISSSIAYPYTLANLVVQYNYKDGELEAVPVFSIKIGSSSKTFEELVQSVNPEFQIS